MPVDLRAQLQQKLGSDYTLERELGGGGMSRVFVVADHRLGRKIVVKALVPDVAGAVSVERFQREIRTAATLQHPCIVPVLTAGDAGGVPFYTMPLVEGETLRQRLAGGPLPIPETVKVLRDVASALGAAHARGVVHRDIKPENVLLSGGYAMVMDFGIAKAISDSRKTVLVDEKSSTALTGLGLALGTPQYMAPEQALASEEIDHRADIYAFGCVAYELLTGVPPFAGRTAQEMFTAHVMDAPAPLEERRLDTPPMLAALVMRCLAKDRANRPQNAEALVETLAEVPIARASTSMGAALPPTSPAVAVLPFANVSSDPENEYLSDGITEELIGALGRVSSLRVAARGSSFAFKGKHGDLKAVAEKLRVASVVEGSVRKAGRRVRITAQLVNAADGFQLWSERYDRELTDIFEVQDEIANAIAAALKGKLLAPEAVAKLATEESGASHPQRAKVNPEAYELYLRGLHVFRNRVVQGGIAKALAHYERALALDPRLAQAYVGIGLANHALAAYSLTAPHDVIPKALAAVESALAIDDTLATAHMLAGYIAHTYTWDWAEADRRYKRALQLAPNDTMILPRAALFECTRGRFERALRLARRAMDVDPLDAWIHYVSSQVHAVAGDKETAVRIAESALELNPHHAESLRVLGRALQQVGRLDDALAAFEHAAVLSNRNPWMVSQMARVHAARGDRAAAEGCVDELLRRRTSERVAAELIAQALVALGRVDEAFEWLDRAMDDRDSHLPWLKVEAAFAPVREDPRFAALVARIGIPG